MNKPEDKLIMVVDDEPDVRHFLATFIEDAGFNVIIACDGQDALEKLENHTPDLITLDMVMPRKTGIEFMRILREKEEWAHLPVIVITAHARDEMGSEDIKSFNAFATRKKPRHTMEKPVTPLKLVEAIQDILEVTPNDEHGNDQGNETRKESIIDAVSKSDAATLDKIRQLLEAAKG